MSTCNKLALLCHTRVTELGGGGDGSVWRGFNRENQRATANIIYERSLSQRTSRRAEISRLFLAWGLHEYCVLEGSDVLWRHPWLFNSNNYLPGQWNVHQPTSAIDVRNRSQRSDKMRPPFWCGGLYQHFVLEGGDKLDGGRSSWHPRKQLDMHYLVLWWIN